MASIEPAPEAASLLNPSWPWPLHRHYVYAAKFLCGELKREGRQGPVEPGSYSTAINVHNPHAFRVGIRRRRSSSTTRAGPKMRSSDRRRQCIATAL